MTMINGYQVKLDSSGCLKLRLIRGILRKTTIIHTATAIYGSQSEGCF
jgi:hypothetical protein